MKRGKHSIQRTPRRHRWLVGLAVIGAVLFAASSAYAYITTTSAGTGFVTIEPGAAFTVSLSPPTGGPLAPGGAQETIAFTVTNSTGTTQILHSETYSIVTDSAGGIYDTLSSRFVDTCLAQWLTASGGDGGVAYPATLAPGASLTNGAVTVSMNDSGGSQNACAGLDPQVEVVAA